MQNMPEAAQSRVAATDAIHAYALRGDEAHESTTLHSAIKRQTSGIVQRYAGSPQMKPAISGDTVIL